MSRREPVLDVDVSRVRHAHARRRRSLTGWMTALRLMAPPIAFLAIAYVIALVILRSHP
jgi:hypothetical protein